MSNEKKSHLPSFVFFACLSAFLLFIMLVGYYLWQIAYGDRDALTQEFRSNKFTKITNATETEPHTTVDIAPFLRSHNPALGQKDAPITIVAFIDFECPFCRESYPIFTDMSKTYAPVIRVVFKHLPITVLHTSALSAANAAACAHEQKKFWAYYDRLFQEQTLEETALIAHAGNVGLNTSQFTACLRDAKYQSNIEEDILDAQRLGIRGTPTYIVNGKKVEGVVPRDAWDTILTQALRDTSL